MTSRREATKKSAMKGCSGCCRRTRTPSCFWQIARQKMRSLGVGFLRCSRAKSTREKSEGLSFRCMPSLGEKTVTAANAHRAQWLGWRGFIASRHASKRQPFAIAHPFAKHTASDEVVIVPQSLTHPTTPSDFRRSRKSRRGRRHAQAGAHGISRELPAPAEHVGGGCLPARHPKLNRPKSERRVRRHDHPRPRRDPLAVDPNS